MTLFAASQLISTQAVNVGASDIEMPLCSLR